MMPRQYPGDVAQLCGLIDVLGSFGEMLRELTMDQDDLNEYPMAEFMCMIFEDGRIADFDRGLASIYGLSPKACDVLHAITEDLVRSNAENRITVPQARKIAALASELGVATWIGELYGVSILKVRQRASSSSRACALERSLLDACRAFVNRRFNHRGVVGFSRHRSQPSASW